MKKFKPELLILLVSLVGAPVWANDKKETRQAQALDRAFSQLSFGTQLLNQNDPNFKSAAMHLKRAIKSIKKRFQHQENWDQWLSDAKENRKFLRDHRRDPGSAIIETQLRLEDSLRALVQSQAWEDLSHRRAEVLPLVPLAAFDHEAMSDQVITFTPSQGANLSSLRILAPTDHLFEWIVVDFSDGSQSQLYSVSLGEGHLLVIGLPHGPEVTRVSIRGQNTSGKRVRLMTLDGRWRPE